MIIKSCGCVVTMVGAPPLEPPITSTVWDTSPETSTIVKFAADGTLTVIDPDAFAIADRMETWFGKPPPV